MGRLGPLSRTPADEDCPASPADTQCPSSLHTTIRPVRPALSPRLSCTLSYRTCAFTAKPIRRNEAHTDTHGCARTCTSEGGCATLLIQPGILCRGWAAGHVASVKPLPSPTSRHGYSSHQASAITLLSPRCAVKRHPTLEGSCAATAPPMIHRATTPRPTRTLFRFTMSSSPVRLRGHALPICPRDTPRREYKAQRSSTTVFYDTRLACCSLT